MARSIYEKKAQKELEAEGYTVDYKARPFRVPYGYSVDYFGRFDLLCWKGEQLRAISIKGHAGVPSDHRKKVESFNVPGIVKEIWTFKTNGQVRKEIIT